VDQLTEHLLENGELRSVVVDLSQELHDRLDSMSAKTGQPKGILMKRAVVLMLEQMWGRSEELVREPALELPVCANPLTEIAIQRAVKVMPTRDFPLPEPEEK